LPGGAGPEREGGDRPAAAPVNEPDQPPVRTNDELREDPEMQRFFRQPHPFAIAGLAADRQLPRAQRPDLAKAKLDREVARRAPRA
jgi:hypothetical protein